MITYYGEFDAQKIIEACKNEANLHYNKNDFNESEVPFSDASGNIRYCQFVKVGDNWVFTSFRD